MQILLAFYCFLKKVVKLNHNHLNNEEFFFVPVFMFLSANHYLTEPHMISASLKFHVWKWIPINRPEFDKPDIPDVSFWIALPTKIGHYFCQLRHYMLL